MRYFIGKYSLPCFQEIVAQIPDIGMLLGPLKSWQNPFSIYALDNGVYGAWTKGKIWDIEMEVNWLNMLSKIPAENHPVWVLLPDVVADWKATVELGKTYLPILRDKGLPVAIALQDGCDFQEALEMEPDWVFVAGSTEWKEANIAKVCQSFHAHNIGVHVGRVNTRRRLMLCQSAGVDSVDGTTLNKFRDASLPLISKTLKQPCLLIDA